MIRTIVEQKENAVKQATMKYFREYVNAPKDIDGIKKVFLDTHQNASFAEAENFEVLSAFASSLYELANEQNKFFDAQLEKAFNDYEQTLKLVLIENKISDLLSAFETVDIDSIRLDLPTASLQYQKRDSVHAMVNFAPLSTTYRPKVSQTEKTVVKSTDSDNVIKRRSFTVTAPNGSETSFTKALIAIGYDSRQAQSMARDKAKPLIEAKGYMVTPKK